VGAILFGHISQVAGRRKGMIALGIVALDDPLWAFGTGSRDLVAAFLMQAGVQEPGGDPGALNELSADARGA